MIALQIDNEFLDLFPDTKFNITEVNPLFDKDSVSRVYTLPLKVPPTYRNKKLLEQSARLDSRSKDIKLDATLFIFRNPYEYGFVQVVGDTEKYIEIRFENQGQGFADQLRDIKIDKILDTINVAFTGTTDLVFELNPAGGQYFLQIDDNTYSYYLDTSPPPTAQDVQQVLFDFIIQINADYPIFADVAPGDQLRLDIENYPNVDIHFDTIQGFTLVDGSNNATDKLDSFHTHVLAIHNTPIDSHAFPVMYNEIFYDRDNASYLNHINHISDGQVIENVPEVEETWKHTFVPFVRVPYILEKIISLISFAAITGDYYESSDFQGLLIYNNVALDEVTFSDFPEGDRYLNHYKQSYDLNDHVPEMTAAAFWSRLTQIFQIYGITSKDKITIRKKIDQVNQRPIDWTDKVAPRYKRRSTEQSGFILRYDRDEDDLNKPTTTLQDYIIGDGTKEITMPFDTLRDQFNGSNFPVSHSWKLPVAIQKGTSTAGKLGKNNYAFRLLIDRGLQFDDNGNTYNLAQSGHLAYNNTDLGYSLDFDGDKGLYENNYKGVIELEEKEEIVVPATLNLSDIRKIKTWDNSKRYFFSSRGAVTGIIKQIQFLADQRGISEVAVTLKKL